MSSSSSSFSFVHCPRLLPLTLSPSFVHPLSRSSTRSFTEFILFLSHIVFFLSPSFLYLSQLDRLLPFLRAPSLIFSLSLSLIPFPYLSHHWDHYALPSPLVRSFSLPLANVCIHPSIRRMLAFLLCIHRYVLPSFLRAPRSIHPHSYELTMQRGFSGAPNAAC